MLEQKINKEQKVEDTTSSQPIAKPHVVRSQNSEEIEQTENYIKILEWLAFIGWLLAIVLVF